MKRRGAARSAVIAMVLLTATRVGAITSLYEPPTRVQMTDETWTSAPLPPKAPSASIDVLLLLQLAPALKKNVATPAPPMMPPATKSERPRAPMENPMHNGRSTARKDGRTAPMAAGLQVTLERLSGLHSVYPSSIWNCLLVSSTRARVALPMASTLTPPMKRGVRAPATPQAKRRPSEAESDSVPPAIRASSPASCLKAARTEKPASTAAAEDQPLLSEAQDSPHMRRDTVVSRTPAVSSWLQASSAL
mmetsp:Transcript_10875/g.28251  ORF Transcript_10875/g.28251 Transcript_10875/m.28251 type:complete len:249 (-) Transcript_10875:311-1057(-)